MKRMIVFLFLFIHSVYGMAQDSIIVYPKFMGGIHAGPGLATNVGGFFAENQVSVQPKPAFSYMGGLFFHYQVLQKMTLCFELNYEVKEVAIFSRYFPNDGSLSQVPDASIPWSGRAIYRDDFLTLPVLVKFKINKKRKRTEWFVKGGLNTGFRVNSSVRHGYNSYLVNNNSDRSFLTFALASGFGVNVPMGKNGVFLVEARDHLNVGNILKYERTNLLALLLGYGYRF